MPPKRSKKSKARRSKSAGRKSARRSKSGGRFRGGEGRYRAAQKWAKHWDTSKLYFGDVQNEDGINKAIFQFSTFAHAWYAYSPLSNGDPMAPGFEVSPETMEVKTDNAEEALEVLKYLEQAYLSDRLQSQHQG